MSDGPEDVSFVGLPGAGRSRFSKLSGLFAMHFQPSGFAQMVVPDTDLYNASKWALNGLTDAAYLASMEQRTGYYARLVLDVPLTYHRIAAGDAIAIGDDTWRVIPGFGHSPEHAALYAERANILISGDMLLPRISTNVSVHAMEPEADPVRQFMESIRRFQPLPNDALVLPSHGRPFRNLHRRVEQLVAHHDARLGEVLDHCASPRTAADIVPIMFRRPLDSHQLFFAFGEALAHLHALWYAGSLRRERGADGIYRFEAS